ncbi:MAG: zinc finger protein [Pseudonocardiaceae bacterium]
MHTVAVYSPVCDSGRDGNVVSTTISSVAWFPLAGYRHAINRADRHVPLGEPMRCLCGAIHPRGPEGDMEWLWPTCEQCWDQACAIIRRKSSR